MAKICISILNWNKSESTEKCLSSISEAGYLSTQGIEIRLCDNGSVEADRLALEGIANRYAIDLSCNSVNAGFAGGHNMAISRAVANNFEYVWLLNNDATVAKGCLEELIAVMKRHPRCGMISPLLCYADTYRAHFWGSVHDWSQLESRWLPAPEGNLSVQGKEIDGFWVIGAAILIRTEAIREVGVLNEEFFAYYEDNEYGCRMNAAGWCSLLALDARVFHSDEAEVGMMRPPYFHYLITRNRFAFFTNYCENKARVRIAIRLIGREARNAERLRQSGHEIHAQAVYLGLQDALAGKMGPPNLTGCLSLWFRLLIASVNYLNIIQSSWMRLRRFA